MAINWPLTLFHFGALGAEIQLLRAGAAVANPNEFAPMAALKPPKTPRILIQANPRPVHVPPLPRLPCVRPPF